MKHCFIVTSAVNSRFGVYTPEERLSQTVDTVSSIRNRVPGAKIVVMEVTGVPLTELQAELLAKVSDVFLDFTDEPDVQELYTSTDNWDVVKNGTEIMCFGRALKLLAEDGEFNGIDRVHKMSGRYTLNDSFDLTLYEQPDVADKVVIGQKFKSQFPVELTDQPWQYMARLWSWPSALLDEVIDVYDRSWEDFTSRVTSSRYTDIEHVLAKFLNPAHVHEVEQIGVEGAIAPNGTAIRN